MGYDAETWDPILTDIASRNAVDPKLLTSIARQENVAAGDFNPLGISPHEGGPTHTGSVETGAAYAEAYVQKNLARFQAVNLKDPDSVGRFTAWYSPPGAVNDPYGTNASEASGILTAAGLPTQLTPRTGYESRYPAPGQASESALMRGVWDDTLVNEQAVEEERLKAKLEKAEAEAEESRRVGKRDDSILAPENLIPKIKANYPEYKDVPDSKLWDSLKAKYPTGLAQLRLAYPQYDKASDDKFLGAIKLKFFPRDSDDQFIDRVNPPTGPMGLYHDIAEQMPRIISGFRTTGLGEPAKLPERIIEKLDQAIRTLGLSQPAPLTKDQEPFQKELEAQGLKYPSNLTPLTTALVGPMTAATARRIWDWANKLQARGAKYAEEKVPAPRNIAGQTAAKGFEALGGAPNAAISFMGGEGAAGLVLGMVYDGVQAEGRAREKGLDNSLMFGAEGMSFRALQQWLLYTPRGRMLSAVLWAATGVGDQEIQAFLTDSKGTLEKAFKDPANTFADLTSTAAVNGFFGGLASLGAERLKPEPRKAYVEAVAARERGDYRQAAQLLDKTMLLLPEPQQKAATNNLLAWRNEAIEARPGDNPMEMPGQRGFLVLEKPPITMPGEAGFTLRGARAAGTEMRPGDEPRGLALPERIPGEIRLLPEGLPREPSRVVPPEIVPRETLAPEPKEAAAPPPEQFGLVGPHGWVETEVPPEGRLAAQGWEEIAQEAELPKLESDNPVDRATDQFYYSGLDIGKAYEELAKLVEKLGVRGIIAPSIKVAKESPLRASYEQAAEVSKVIIGKRLGQAQRDNVRMIQAWYRQQKLEDHLKWAYETDQRRAYWEGIKVGIRRKMFEQHEAGLSTGNAVADRMWDLHHGAMKGIARMDEARGWHYPLRDSYIFHNLKNPADIDRLEADIVRLKWGDPKFMKPRQIPDMATVHALGYELKNYNPEDNVQARLEQSNRAETLAAMLEDFHEAKLAYTKAELYEIERTNPRQAAEIRSQLYKPTRDHPSEFWRSPKAKDESDVHNTYYLHQSAGDLLVRALDPVNWNPALLGQAISGAQAVKQLTVGVNLGGSLYHPLHIAFITQADTLAHAFSTTLAGRGSFSDWARALEDLGSAGLASHRRAYTQYEKLLNWFQARDATILTQLSKHNQQLVKWMADGGFVPQISKERQIQLGRLIMAQRGKIPERPGLDPVDLAYNVISTRWFQKWYFGRMVPLLKILSFDRAVQSLFAAKPHLLKPQYELDRMQALRGIARQVDDRYGEQNLRQTFEEPHLKALGVGTLTSYSWLKSFLGVYGGGIHDMTKLIGDRPITRAGTNRVAYLLTLSVQQMAIGGAVSQFIGDGIKNLMDLIWPNIGHDAQGKPIRVKPPFWMTTEIGGAWHDIQKYGPGKGLWVFFQNKMAPALFTIFEIANNHDYYGTQIRPEWDKKKGYLENTLDQIKASAEYTLRQSAPFVVQQWLRPGSTPKDVLLQFLGVPPAAKWTMRSEMENRIIDDYIKNLPPEKTRSAQDQIDAKSAYRDAVNRGDAYAREAALSKMRELHMSEKSIKETERTANFTEAQRIFYHLSGDKQQSYWTDMSAEDKAEFGPMLHKKEKSLLQRMPAVGMQEGGLVPQISPMLPRASGARSEPEQQQQPLSRVQPFSPGASGGQGQAQGFGQGGQAQVPGSGLGDKVPALLEPGEFVIKKSAVKRIGVDKLRAMNNPPLYERSDSGKA